MLVLHASLQSTLSSQFQQSEWLWMKSVLIFTFLTPSKCIYAKF